MKTEQEYVDLGLPSGTLWKAHNEDGFYTFNDVVEKYGDGLPSREQWKELKDNCQWDWIDDGYRVTGPNGNCIVLPTEGYRSRYGIVSGVDTHGFYWSSTPNDFDDAWFAYFYYGSVHISYGYRHYGFSVRLVQKSKGGKK